MKGSRLEGAMEIAQRVADGGDPSIATRDEEDEGPWITVAEAAKIGRCSKDKIYEACTSHKLKHRQEKPGAKIETKARWVEQWKMRDVKVPR